MTVIAIAKLKAYGPDKPTLYLINDYLSFRNQRTQIRYSLTGPMLLGVFSDLYFSIFSSLTFSYLLKNLINAILLTIASFPCGDNLSVILKSLKHDSAVLDNST